MNRRISVARAGVRAYQLAAAHRSSPCRYLPTCSQYALDALDRYGVLTASRLTAGRIVRCGPWGGHGFDPVPERKVG